MEAGWTPRADNWRCSQKAMGLEMSGEAMAAEIIVLRDVQNVSDSVLNSRRSEPFGFVGVAKYMYIAQPPSLSTPPPGPALVPARRPGSRSRSAEGPFHIQSAGQQLHNL